MKNTDRVLVYFGGFVLGMLLVSLILSRRDAREAKADAWLDHNYAMVEAGAEPLPEGVPAPFQAGRMIDFGYLPSEETAERRVWLLNFDDSYPFVRIVEDLETKSLRYMAADQVQLKLVEGRDVTELKPMLDELGLRLRMFSRKENVAVIGVLHTGIGAVPDTLNAIQPWQELFERAEPDWIRLSGDYEEHD
jgi:hypothetical protein